MYRPFVCSRCIGFVICCSRTECPRCDSSSSVLRLIGDHIRWNSSASRGLKLQVTTWAPQVCSYSAHHPCGTSLRLHTRRGFTVVLSEQQCGVRIIRSRRLIRRLQSRYCTYPQGKYRLTAAPAKQIRFRVPMTFEDQRRQRDPIPVLNAFSSTLFVCPHGIASMSPLAFVRGSVAPISRQLSH